MVGLDHAVLGVDRAPLHPSGSRSRRCILAGDIGAAGLTALADLVNFVDEDDAVILHGGDDLLLELPGVDQPCGLLLDQAA